MERAIEIAARVPEADLGLVEVRPVLDLSGMDVVSTTTEVEGLLRELGAAGPRRARAALRRLRHLRGRRAGGAAGGRAAVAGRRRAREPEGLADHRRVPPADRAVAQRVGPPAAGGDRRRAAGRRAGVRTRPRRRRHAHAAAAVLPPVAHAGLPGGPDAARRRRADHGRDRPRVPGPRGDRRAAHQPGEAADQGQRRRVPDAAGGRALGADGGGAARAVPDLQRGLHRQLRARRCIGSS